MESDGPRLVVSNSSADNNTPLTAAARSIFKCQSPGTLRRSRHFLTDHSVAPSPTATAAIPGQRSSEKMSIAECMDNSSTLSMPTCLLDNVVDARQLFMAANEPGSRVLSGICRRTKEAREDAGYTQTTIATALSVTKDRYAKWENRGAMPPEFMIKFCFQVKRDPTWILTGDLWPASLHNAPVRRKPRRRTA